MVGYSSAAAALAAILGAASTLEPSQTLTAAAADGTIVSIYDYRSGKPADVAPVLIFHQAGGDARGELGPIAEKLAAGGRRVFTADLRSGGDRFGGVNATAAAYKGPEPGYCDVYPDLVAALDKAAGEAGRPVVVIGSSYSATLAVKLAAEHPAQVAGVAGFSPAGGEPMKGCEAEPWLAGLKAPALAVRNKGSLAVPWVGDSNGKWAAAGYPVTMIDAEGHGASLLLPERTKGDTAAAWRALSDFLAKVDAGARRR